MKKSIITLLLAVTAFLSITGCKNAETEKKAVKTSNTALQGQEWMVERYRMNGLYNPATKELYTIDVDGNTDLFDDIELSWFNNGLEYWQDVNENGFCDVWVTLMTNGTRTITDDEVDFIPGHGLNVFESYEEIHNINGDIFIGEDLQ